MLIRFTAPWRNAGAFWNAGDYRIPLDMPATVAETALLNGVAVRLDTEPKRKGPAPENKAATPAETK